MRVLGISAFHRDSAAALVIDGQVVAAAQEERFTRKPLDPAFPKRAIRFCLQHASVRAANLDRVVFYEKPLRKFERVLATQMLAFPRSGRSFARSAFVWLGDRLWVKGHIAKELGVELDRIVFVEHELALAANAFHTSPFASAAILTVDDAGEWATATMGRAGEAGVEISRELRFPHSLGLVVSAITQYLGFVPGEDEYKIEALAAYGVPRFADEIGTMVPEEESWFSVDQSRFRFAFDSDRLYEDGLVETLGPARFVGEPLCYAGGDTRHADVAASLQQVIEQRVMGLARELHELIPTEELCFAGELAGNTRLNARLRTEGPFQAVFVPVAPGKAGGAIGAALHVHHSALASSGERSAGPPFDPRLGEAVDDRAEDGAQPLEDGRTPADEVLRRLLAGQRVAWVRGRMDFGPRSFGNRSLFALPTEPDARRVLLGTVQCTESFLPCRLALPRECAAELAAESNGIDELVARGHARVRAAPPLCTEAPSGVDPDGMAWLHLVDCNEDPELHGLLIEIGKARTLPALLQADFAPRGSPIVRNEADAVEAFRRSTLDCLVVARRVYEPVERRAM